jgi:hypothetical protein
MSDLIENIIGYTVACGFACICAFAVACGYMTLTGDADHVASLLNANASITANRNMTTSDVVSEPVSEDPFNFVYEEQPAKIGYVGADGHTITFVHNSSAVNPTYEQVISFLKSDTTDQTPYDLNKFTCGDYAEHVQHNAEATGYRCGWIFIELNDGYRHACDVFNTTDKGLVFVDSTTFDSVVDVKEGSEYHPVPLSKLLGYNSGVSADSMGVVKSYTIEW